MPMLKFVGPWKFGHSLFATMISWFLAFSSGFCYIYWRVRKGYFSYLFTTAIRLMQSHTHTPPPILSIATLDELNNSPQWTPRWPGQKELQRNLQYKVPLFILHKMRQFLSKMHKNRWRLRLSRWGAALMLEKLIRLHPPVLRPYGCYRRDGREERKRWVVWSLARGGKFQARPRLYWWTTAGFVLNDCSDIFQIVQFFHLTSFDSWVLCTLNNYRSFDHFFALRHTYLW